MFDKNDKALLTAKSIIKIFIGVNLILSFVVGIVLAVKIHWICIFITFGWWILCWIMWAFASLYLCFLIDIKLIRNKLYDKDNSGLETFFAPISFKSKITAFSIVLAITVCIAITVIILVIILS